MEQKTPPAGGAQSSPGSPGSPGPIVPIVIGTAGHIDHGKSSLVRAMTGQDPDRLKEEKERGLTIDLGFAPLRLTDGRLVGMVDVPGHERFVRNMVAGATGIDLVLLVVAADDGVMPQTREHLDIMELLGVRRGVIALNKVDATDAELVELARQDVIELVAGTFLEDAPILPVSAVTGQGVDELKSALESLAAETEPRSSEGVFRMPIQRVFSAPGFGTIVTGIPINGSVRIGDALEIVPGSERGRVRSIQAYHEKTETGRAGHSTAINLSDVDHKAVHRGHVLCTPKFFEPVSMVGAEFRALASLARPIKDRTSVRLHVGTKDAAGEIVLLDAEVLRPGDQGLVQLRLQEPVVCAPGDRFILRQVSPVVTLGGGVVLEESRYRLKRFKGFVLDELTRQRKSLDSPRELLASTLFRAGLRLSPEDDLAAAIKRSRNDTRALLAELEADGRSLSPAPGRWLHRERFDEALATLRETLESWVADHAHRSVVEVLELRRLLGFEAPVLAALLDAEAQRGALVVESGGTVRLAGREVELDERTSALRSSILERLEASRFQPPSLEKLAPGASPEDVRVVLELLEDEDVARHIGREIWFATSAIEEARAAIVANCHAHGHLVIPELRDVLDTTRKWLIPLLEYFDAKGLTHRQAGHRVLKRR